MKRILLSDWLPERAGGLDSPCPLGMQSLTLPARKEKVFFFRHITPLLTKREVKTARYCPRTYTLPLSSRLDRTSLVKVNNTYSWFATTQQGGHVGGRYNRIYMKIEFGSQRREMLLFLTSNMAAVTSRTNQQYITWDFPTLCLTRKRKTSVPGKLFLV